MFTKRFQHKLIPVIHRNTGITDGSLFLPQNIKRDFFLKIQSNKLTIAISHLTIIILIFFLTVLNLHLTIIFSFHHGKKINNNNNNKCNATLFHNSDFFFPIEFPKTIVFFPTKLCYKLIIPSLHLAIFTFFLRFLFIFKKKKFLFPTWNIKKIKTLSHIQTLFIFLSCE